jgi:A/G-specific adenine glycosylase
MKKLSGIEIIKFQKLIWNFYKMHGRKMPWRGEVDPYKVLVSEVMLQQTQASRVIPKYQEFLKKFPTLRKLAKAKLSEVLIAWSGLGYNRRAKFLWQLAQVVEGDYKGKIPSDPLLLIKLPGIGKGTAGSIAAFAFNQPVVFIETNIRRVFIHSFFPGRKIVYDTELTSLIRDTLDTKNPREWYYALMDYGAKLKEGENSNRRSAHYVKQSKFNGSNREVRGAILKYLAANEKIAKRKLLQKIPFDRLRINKAVTELVAEGFLEDKRGIISVL